MTLTGPLIRTAYRAAQWVRLGYWRLFRPVVHGAKMVVLGPDDSVLLIRHSYARQTMFMLPGGGVRRGEDAARAAAREVFEETAIAVRNVRLHGQFLDTSKGARNHISIFVGVSDGGTPRVDGREIVEARWLPLHDLPVNLSSASRKRIEEVRDGHAPPNGDWP